MLQGPRAAQVKKQRQIEVQQFEFEAQRPVREAEAQFKRTAYQLALAEREIAAGALLHEPSDYLKEHCTGYTGTPDASGVEDALRDAVGQMKLQLHERGIMLTDRGFQKLACVVQKNLQTVDSTSTKNLMTIFDYMDSLGVFNDEDCNRPAPAPKVTPTPAPSAPVDIENLELTSREGAAAGRQWALEGLVEEAAALYRVFKQHLRDVWSVEISKEDGDACVQYIRKNGLNLCDKRSWDAARKNVLHLLTPDEKLCADIELTSTSLDQYSVRRDFRKRQHEAIADLQ